MRNFAAGDKPLATTQATVNIAIIPPMPTRALPSLAATLLLLASACDQKAGDEGSNQAANTESSADAKAEPADEKPPATPPKGNAKEGGDGDQGNLGKLTGKGVVAIDQILNKTPDQVDALLGTPTQSAKPRVSCVRFLPERVFFTCDEEVHVYENADTQVKLVEVDFEDGKAASVALIGLPGEGAFTPEKALALAGLELPGEPKVDQPTDFLPPNATSVTVWGYWNSSARLIIDGLQYRVEISIVDEDWERSKIKILVNHPLSDDQKARVKQPKSG
jgi:hypothetical protein